MNQSVYHIWQFLRIRGVRSIRVDYDHVELLLENNRVVTPSQLLNEAHYEVEQRRPVKIVISRIPIRSPWGVDDILPQKMREIMGYATSDDKLLGERCDRENEELKVWWADINELFNLIRFGKEPIPAEFSPNPPRVETDTQKGGGLVKLTNAEKETLYPEVMNDLEEYYFGGRYGSWRAVYVQLAHDSVAKYMKVLKGRSLTPGQIKGIHTNKTKFTRK